MCKENREYFIILLAGLLLASVVGVLRGEEPGQWYLISEAELQNIERYRNSRESERQIWLSQASALNQRLRSSEQKSAAHEQTVSSLNSQLVAQREVNRNLTSLFNKYETDQLILVSSKNGEIAKLKEEKAETTLEAEKYKSASRSRLFIIIALAGTWIVFIAFKVCRFFRII
jgi:uncharacterized coiled-coil protein SlyX